MSDLLSSLSLASRALSAQQAGLDVTGQNIANVNTVGYTRRSIELTAEPPSDGSSVGNGVSVSGIRSARADIFEAQLRFEQPTQGREAAVATALSQVETALGASGKTVDTALTQFYAAFAQLAQDPTSGAYRQQVSAKAQGLASTFNDVAGRLASAQRDADTQIRAGVEQINSLSIQIASINASLVGAPSATTEALKDKLNVALGSLSKLIDINAVPRNDGGADVTIGNGHSLVIGANPYALQADSAPFTGLADLKSGGTSIGSQITGGQIGGLLHVRDTLVPGYIAQLDQLAYGVATSVNAIHIAGYDLHGAPGGDFFNAPAVVSGAAAGMAVSAAIVADPSTIAAAASPNAGDNDQARALTNLQQTPLDGLTTNPGDTWGTIVYRVGMDSQAASNELASHDEIIRQLETLRDQTSGVSLDEEAANMIKFQRAYEANARYFSAVEAALNTLMTTIGG